MRTGIPPLGARQCLVLMSNDRCKTTDAGRTDADPERHFHSLNVYSDESITGQAEVCHEILHSLPHGNTGNLVVGGANKRIETKKEGVSGGRKRT